jgi:hypothetical protein
MREVRCVCYWVLERWALETACVARILTVNENSRDRRRRPGDGRSEWLLAKIAAKG